MSRYPRLEVLMFKAVIGLYAGAFMLLLAPYVLTDLFRNRVVRLIFLLAVLVSLLISTTLTVIITGRTKK